jgi:hypothetical protein
VTHDRARELLLDLAYGELPPDEARGVERHAAECPGCAAELEGIVATRQLAARLADEPAPARGREELLAAARRAAARAPARRARARLYAFAASAAVIAVVAGVTLQLSGGRSKGIPDDGFTETSGRARLEEPPAAPAPSADTAAPSAPRGDVAREARDDAGIALERAQRSPPAGAPPPARPGIRERANAARAQTAGRAEEAQTRYRSEAEPRSIADDIERREAAGLLREQAWRLVCDGAAIERVALVDGGAVVKLTVRDGGGAAYAGWYDAAGRLRAIRHGESAAIVAPGGETTSPAALPPRAPAPDALARCGW